MKFSTNFLMIASLLPLALNAQPAPEQPLKVAEPSQRLQAVVFPQKMANQHLLSETEQALLADPELTRQVINRTIDAGQIHLLPRLISLYQQFPHADQVLIRYGNGIVAMANQNFRQGIDLFEQILVEYPDFHPVRLRLAQALFADYQTKDAKQAFAKLAQSPLPVAIQQQIQLYQQAIEQREKWRWQFGLNYLQDDNVNNASEAEYIYVGNVPFKKNADSLPQSAKGFNYSFNLSKTFNLFGNHALIFENQFSGKSFWNNHAFDDHTNRTSLGYQYQQAQLRLAVLPFYERRWYANHRYNKGQGIRLEAEKWFGSQWQLSLATEQSRLKYHAGNRALNSRNSLLSSTLLYAINSQSYVYLGADYQRDKTQDRTLASIRYTGRLGWGQQWGKNFGSRIQLSYGKRNFDAKHRLLLKIRQDKEFSLNVSLWHKKLQLWGIMPKLNYQYSRVQSNLASLYSTHKQRIYLDFQKVF